MRSWDSAGCSDGLSRFNRALDSVNLRESPLRHAQNILGNSRSREADGCDQLSGAKQLSCSSWVSHTTSQEEHEFAAGFYSTGGELQWVSYTVSWGLN